MDEAGEAQKCLGCMGNGKNLNAEVRCMGPRDNGSQAAPLFACRGALGSPSCVLGPCAGDSLDRYTWWPWWPGLGKAGPHTEAPPNQVRVLNWTPVGGSCLLS